MSQNLALRRDTAADSAAAVLIPLVDVIEDAFGITLYADLPGVPKDKLDLHVDGEVLTIEGEVSSALAEDAAVLHREVALPRFKRAFTLSRELDASQVGAELTQGVLKLRIPKKAQAQPRRIEVKLA